MKILLTHRYFWPDSPPYGDMLRAIAEALAAEGHAVGVFASLPSYRGRAPAPRRERAGGVDIRRIAVLPEKTGGPLARLANVVLYCGGLVLHILRRRPDIVTAASFPPVLAAASACMAARLVGARFVYHVQDIHPEVSRYAGGPLGRGRLFRALRWLDTRTLRRAAAVVVLSSDMAATLRARPGGAELPLLVINNFALDDDLAAPGPPPAEAAKPHGRIRAIFAGNIGRFQGLGALVDTAALLTDIADFEIAMLGDGAALATLKARAAGLANLRFMPHLRFAEARSVIADADIGIVSLQPGIHRVAYPSKTLTYLNLGLPLLAVVEPESEIARMVEAEGLGAVARERDGHAIAAAIRGLIDRRAELPCIGERGRALYRERFGRATALARWRHLVAEIADPREPGAGAPHAEENLRRQ